jgi:hypothetical protein
MTDTDARDMVLALLEARAPEATVCPSEVARAMTTGGSDLAGDWRNAMPLVHAAIDTLLSDGLVQLSWKGTS